VLERIEQFVRHGRLLGAVAARQPLRDAPGEQRLLAQVRGAFDEREEARLLGRLDDDDRELRLDQETELLRVVLHPGAGVEGWVSQIEAARRAARPGVMSRSILRASTSRSLQQVRSGHAAPPSP